MKPKPKVVFDTNIYISGVIFGGNPRACLELAREREIELYSGSEILFELSQKMKTKFRWEDSDIVDLIGGVARFAKVVKPKVTVNRIEKDPTDNKILECAVEARADFIVSGDVRHILSLKKFRNIRILSSKEFLDLYYKQ